MKTAAILIREPEQQFEGLRTGVGLLQAGIRVLLFVLHHEIKAPDEACRNCLAAMDELEGERYSDIAANVNNYGFKLVSLDDVAGKIDGLDAIIPF